MKKLIFYGALLFLLIAFAACGNNGPIEEDPEPTPTLVVVDSVNGGTPSPVPAPMDMPRFDHHEASLTIDPISRTVSGISRITFTNRFEEPLDTIVFRLFLNALGEGEQGYFRDLERRIFRPRRDYGYMDIHHVTLNNEDMDYRLAGTVLSLLPAEPLAPGDTVQLVLKFDAYVPMIAHRTGANNRAMWFGMFLPLVAAHGTDGWLTPDYYSVGNPFVLPMATFEVEVITPANYIVAGAGAKTGGIVLEDDDTRVTAFTANNARDFAFAISPYFRHEWVSTVGGDVHLYFYTEDLPVDRILEIVNISMEFFSDRIGQYPFDNIRIVETDMFLSGVGFSNVIFMDTNALRRPDAMALAREMGHQWFSNVVGSNPVEDPWLDRGLVRYIRAGLFNDTARELRNYMAEAYTQIAGRDDLYLAHGLDAFDTWRDYFQTHHLKGMLMFNALNLHMGDELFWELIRQYFQTFYFQIASGQDFMSLAEEIYGGSLESFFDEWFADGTMPPLTLDEPEGEALTP